MNQIFKEKTFMRPAVLRFEAQDISVDCKSTWNSDLARDGSYRDSEAFTTGIAGTRAGQCDSPMLPALSR